jgi:putative acetyltransferase
MNIRQEKPTDYAAVRLVNESAFETSAEANLVDVLRRETDPFISLVAEMKGAIAGHILFSPVSLEAHPHLKIMGLGPMAVSPEHQGNGIGSALVKNGLERCREIGYGVVVVLGHPWFYPRFGFAHAQKYGIISEYNVPPEVFMLIELQPGYLQDAKGIIHYHPAFNTV